MWGGGGGGGGSKYCTTIVQIDNPALLANELVNATQERRRLPDCGTAEHCCELNGQLASEGCK